MWQLDTVGEELKTVKWSTVKQHVFTTETLKSWCQVQDIYKYLVQACNWEDIKILQI